MSSARWTGRTGLGVLCSLMLGGTAPATASITGVCPDGSIFIVQRSASIPCRGAKEVQPEEVPPIRPELLPRPYTWQVYEEGSNPQNPYFLLDAARDVRAMQRNRDEEAAARSQAAEGPAPQATHARSLQGVRSLNFGEGELRDLFLIVELSQEATDAHFVKRTADGRTVQTVSLAHSQAFATRLGRILPRSLDAGPVLLWSAVAGQTDRFDAMLSFVQGHLAFHPDAGDPEQFGILQGHLGELESGEAVLGYVVLPASHRLDQPMDVYWNDRRATVSFVPLVF